MRFATRVVAAVVVLSVMALALLGCGGSTGSGASGDAGGTAATSTTGVVLDGAALVAAKCTKCHPRDRVDQANKNLAGWQATIDRMITKHGATITPSEKSVIASYLANH